MAAVRSLEEPIVLAAPIALPEPRRRGRRLANLPIVPSTVLGLLVVVAVLAPLLAPYEPTIPVPGAGIFRPPFWMERGSVATLLGTDFQGRDVVSRLMYGARVSLVVGLTGTAVAGGIGLLLGLLAGYFGGWIDQAIMRLTDAWLAMPFLMFAIFLAALLGPGISNIIIVFGLLYWTRYARVIRNEVRTLRERDFVRLAQAAGVSNAKIIRRHIFPNVLNTWMVLASLTVGVVIVTEASLSFLGLGVPPPTPAWGLMIAEARTTLMGGQWWLAVFPGICISVVVLAANMFGDWLRVRLDPQQQNL
jgi:peptide/nickel transport system permease protein